MYYESELRLIRDVFRKCHLQTLILDVQDSPDLRVDMGLRQLLMGGEAYTQPFTRFFSAVEGGAIYHFTDAYLCEYVYFLLPEMPQECAFLLGPYLSKELSRDQLLELVEKNGLSPHVVADLETYYAALPLLSPDSALAVMLETFAEQLWSNDLKTVDVRREADEASWDVPVRKDGDTAWNMDMMQRRYDYENELMRAVEQGQSHRAAIFFERISETMMEARTADPLRNFQNYCVIMNTLLRKAAEKGGVHPLYLDKVSSEFAHKIERLPGVSFGQGLMQEMFRSYCHLVRKHSMKNYSAPIQKTVAYIDADLTADLSLHALASAQNISDGYLSALFHRETGQTLTAFVNERRMKAACRLLTTTKLQIQTVAQHCGILDIHYFSRLFKKYTGMTPLDYRDSHR